MKVCIVEFPETKVAVAEHRGAPQLEYETSKKLIAWRIENRLSPTNHKSYGVHYTNPYKVAASDHRVDFCVSYDSPVQPNTLGIVSKVIPANRCAVARHLGPRSHNSASIYLYQEWLPRSGESLGDFPVFFHYVNVGPQVEEHEMITDVYLPLK